MIPFQAQREAEYTTRRVALHRNRKIILQTTWQRTGNTFVPKHNSQSVNPCYDTAFAYQPLQGPIKINALQRTLLSTFTKNAQAFNKTLLTCDIVTAYAYRYIFTQDLCYQECGPYLGPDITSYRRKPNQPYTHWWLRFLDGTIVDATANQFRDQETIRIVQPLDARQQWYGTFPSKDSPISEAFIPWKTHRAALWLQYLETQQQHFLQRNQQILKFCA
jgi:hypothetical protein